MGNQVARKSSKDDQVITTTMTTSTSSNNHNINNNKNNIKESDILLFYSKTCPFTERAQPIIEAFEKETESEILKKEINEEKEHYIEYKNADRGRCGGVPFFINKSMYITYIFTHTYIYNIIYTERILACQVIWFSKFITFFCFC